MPVFLLLKLIHIISATVLFGTGLGTAFYFWRVQRTGDARLIATVAHNVVLADWWFTTPAIIIQPLSGIAMMSLMGYALTTPWIVSTLALYGAAGACWLPVVWLQLRLRDLALSAASQGQSLGPLYQKYFRLWFMLGWPAFISVLLIFGLMIYRPLLWG